MRRRTVEVAVVVVAAMGVEAREARVRGGEPMYCPPIRMGGVVMGGSLWPAEDGALKGRRYTGSGEAPSAEKSSGEETSLTAGDALKHAPTTAAAAPATTEGEFAVKDFRFRDGETMAELRLHYATLGKPARDAAGKGTNAGVLVRVTGGPGGQILDGQFAGEMFWGGVVVWNVEEYTIFSRLVACWETG